MTPREHLETLAAMHLEVAAYVEKLSGPDREVDAKIAALLGSGWLREGVGVPAYTGSLDAAMGLVPEGQGWVIRAYDAPVWAFCGDGEVDDPSTGIAATPTLALCTAALRARASALTGYGENGE